MKSYSIYHAFSILDNWSLNYYILKFNQLKKDMNLESVPRIVI